MKSRGILAVLAVAIFGAGTAAASVAMEYEPHKVVLRGRLATKTFFGPPGYGENPKTDSKEEEFILALDEPVDVIGNASDPINSETVKDVKEVTVVLLPARGQGPQEQQVALHELSALVGKHVIVHGSLFHAHTGHHHTPILIQTVELPTSG